MEHDTTITTRDMWHQFNWSRRTFGPGQRLKGVVEHIKKELKEVLAKPDDVEEWADLLILVIDGALRSEHSPQDLIHAYHDKVAKNLNRKWPDWRLFTEDQAIEHVPDDGE